MFSNYMENMSPFVKLKRSGKEKEGLPSEGLFLLLTTNCSLAAQASPQAHNLKMHATLWIKMRAGSICTHASAIQKCLFKRHPLYCLDSIKIAWLIKQLEQGWLPICPVMNPGNLQREHSAAPLFYQKCRPGHWLGWVIKPPKESWDSNPDLGFSSGM